MPPPTEDEIIAAFALVNAYLAELVPMWLSLSSLSFREAEILKLHYTQDMDLTAIATLYKVTPYRIRALHNSALRKMVAAWPAFARIRYHEMLPANIRLLQAIVSYRETHATKENPDA